MGSRLSLALLARGHSVRLFDKVFNQDLLATVEKFGSACEVITGCVEDPIDRDLAIQGTSAVFHFISASVPATLAQKLDIEIQTNVPQTLDILNAMQRHGVDRIIYPSSGGAVYGEALEGSFREDSSLNPMGAYGMGKLLVEEMLRYHRRTSGLKDLIVRISNAYGAVEALKPMQGAVDIFLKRHAEGKPLPLWGDGTAVRDYIHIDDILEGLVVLYERDLHGLEVNLGSGTGSSLREVISIIEQISGRPVHITHRDGMYAGVRRSVLNVTLLKQLTGFTARTTLEEGIFRSWSQLSLLNPREVMHHSTLDDQNEICS